MREPHLTAILLVTMISIGIIHQLALINFWYWSVWWMDVVLHLLGGFAIGLFILWIHGVAVSEQHGGAPRYLLLAVVGSVLLIGVGWEVFEYYAGLFMAERFFPDTVYDLFSDLAGGLLAYTYYYFLKKFHITHHG